MDHCHQIQQPAVKLQMALHHCQKKIFCQFIHPKNNTPGKSKFKNLNSSQLRGQTRFDSNGGVHIRQAIKSMCVKSFSSSSRILFLDFPTYFYSFKSKTKQSQVFNLTFSMMTFYVIPSLPSIQTYFSHTFLRYSKYYIFT